MSRADAFEAFVLEFQDMVFGTAVRLLGSPADAEDIAQTVFLKAFERFDDIGSSPTAAGWLKTVTTNACLNHLSRYRARWRFFSELGQDDSGEGDRDYAATIASETPVTDDLERADDRHLLETALRRLPPDQRVPLVLFHFEEKSYRDIASLLGVSLAKVKTDIHRGREALKTHLGVRHGAS